MRYKLTHGKKSSTAKAEEPAIIVAKAANNTAFAAKAQRLSNVGQFAVQVLHKQELTLTTILALGLLYSWPASAAELELKPAFETSGIKVAAITFLPDWMGEGNTGGIDMDINHDSKWCEQNGFTVSCPAQQAAYETCSRDKNYVKCNKVTWCKRSDNNYTVSSCPLPSYLDEQCPNGEKLYKRCKENKPQACKDSGYTSSCSSGQVLYNASNRCPWDNSYGKCCTPAGCPQNSATSCTGAVKGTDVCGYSCKACCESSCPSGYNYSSIPSGYLQDGEPCNHCSGLKYKVKINPCTGYKDCTYSPASSASNCLSGSTIKYSSCNSCPDGFLYDNGNCGGKLLGSSCGGKYTDCITSESAGGIYYSKGTPIGVVVTSGLVVGMSQRAMAWGPFNDTPAPNYNYSISSDWNGKSNTITEVNALGSSTSHAPGYCYNYSAGSKGAGSWFLPAYSQLRQVYNNAYAINNTLSIIGGTRLGNYGYWTSSEGVVSINERYRAWAIYFGNGDYYDLSKLLTATNSEKWNTTLYARCTFSY